MNVVAASVDEQRERRRAARRDRRARMTREERVRDRDGVSGVLRLERRARWREKCREVERLGWSPRHGKLYRLNRAMFEELYHAQGGACWICRKPFGPLERPVVDHDHATRVIRSLLCSQCNTGIGLLGDTPDALRRVADCLAVRIAEETIGIVYVKERLDRKGRRRREQRRAERLEKRSQRTPA